MSSPTEGAAASEALELEVMSISGNLAPVDIRASASSDSESETPKSMRRLPSQNHMAKAMFRKKHMEEQQNSPPLGGADSSSFAPAALDAGISRLSQEFMGEEPMTPSRKTTAKFDEGTHIEDVSR